MLTNRIKSDVLRECNYNIVPEAGFDYANHFPSEWFIDYFSFLNNPALSKYLGEAYYQARFVYKMMKALTLTKAKHYAFLKFQILQYASIYEAILDYCLSKYYKSEITNRYAEETYTPVPALSKDTNITYQSDKVVLCKRTKRAKPIKLIRIQYRTEFAVEKGIISSDMGKRICDLYNVRNNVHILKATEENYKPKVAEAKTAWEIMTDFVAEIKIFLNNIEKE